MFFTRIATALIVTVFLCALFGSYAQAESIGPSVVINELMWMGSSSSSSDEWIELRNVTSASVPIGGWKLMKRSGGQDVTMLIIPDGKQIPANGYFLISHFASESVSTQLLVQPDLIDTHVSLLNSALQIKLYDGQGVLVDSADDGSGTPLAGSYETGKTYASMARNGVPGDGTQKWSWHTSAVSANLKSSATRGTPGVVNDSVPPVVTPISDQAVIVGTPVTFDASDAYSPDGNQLSYAWDFGDGGTSTLVSPVHAYATVGTYHGTLVVTDGAITTSVSFAMSVTAVPTETSTSPVPTTPSGIVLLSELLPNPGTGQEEFIELAVTGGAADVSGWMLSDRGGTVYHIPQGTVIAEGRFLSVTRTVSRIALNNDGDSVTLLRPDGTSVDTVTYGVAEKGAAYATDGTAWRWTTKPTPGSANMIIRLNHAPIAAFSCETKKRATERVTCTAADSSDEDGDSLMYSWTFDTGTTAIGKIVTHVFSVAGTFPVGLTVKDSGGLTDSDDKNVTIKAALKATPAKKSGTVAGAEVVTTMADAKDASSGTGVALSGWVMSVPGALGANVWYLTDGSDGIQVRSTVTLPKFAIGDAVFVRGERRTQSGEAYVRITSADDVIVRGTPRVLDPQNSQAASIDSDSIGTLANVTGSISSLNGNRFTIDDGSGEITVYLKATAGIKKPALHAGDQVSVIGIISMTSSGIRILPRQTDDLIVTVPALTPVQNTVIVPRVRRPTWWMYALVVGCVLCGIGFGLWHKQKQPSA